MSVSLFFSLRSPLSSHLIGLQLNHRQMLAHRNRARKPMFHLSITCHVRPDWPINYNHFDMLISTTYLLYYCYLLF